MDIIIIGAGLTGMTLAYYLRNSGKKVIVLEARNRTGGRIHTLRKSGQAPLEMGATWLGKKHQSLRTLLEELELKIFPQALGQQAIFEPISTSPPQLVQLPINDEPSYRIQGGTGRILDALQAKIPEVEIHLMTAVTALKYENNAVMVSTNIGELKAQQVISTLPPCLLIDRLEITPALPTDVVQLARQTHTWMGESIKVALTFKTPFWRGGNLSGTIFSNVGPIPEMYDHADVEDKHFALKGFLNGSYFSLTKAERLDRVLTQLRKYFGPKVDAFEHYEETVWRKEVATFTPYASHVLPHQFNGHPAYRQAFWDGRFFIAGAETASVHPGYMDGAVTSAQWILQQLQKGL